MSIQIPSRAHPIRTIRIPNPTRKLPNHISPCLKTVESSRATILEASRQFPSDSPSETTVTSIPSNPKACIL
ncbi:uncharacterized protein Bfra_005340 [Botrytis fragariae]|uniref:Uncharacterized protein n=1 Tax=Botrytis fragariae TaxID=1964551 RepID=A0A8H6EIV9_9HELO|nr:uncharacterized protein Bfra_005340 [Botrytis fragariae]KAF5873873.1 hypothetical protein Bfra_005340 [Botrytis fragariae]